MWKRQAHLPRKHIDNMRQDDNALWTDNRICRLFGIAYPIIAGGMVWCSGWRLASAVSNNGGLGLLGAGSMHPDVLQDHIHKIKDSTDKPWGVNIPLMYPEIDKLLQVILDEHVPIVFTSAGSPKKYTPLFHDHGIKVAHVVSSSKFAHKCDEAGVDAIVAEGFEAGGHDGREESTTLTLIPQVRHTTETPLIAAGGIGSGAAIAAVEMLGAEGVQIGTLFALSRESSAAEAFKQACIDSEEGGTMMALKKIAPTRLLRNALYNRIHEAEERGADVDELRAILGSKAAKRGIFEGDITDGELEIGQIASAVESVRPAADIIRDLVEEYRQKTSGCHRR